MSVDDAVWLPVKLGDTLDVSVDDAVWLPVQLGETLGVAVADAAASAEGDGERVALVLAEAGDADTDGDGDVLVERRRMATLRLVMVAARTPASAGGREREKARHGVASPQIAHCFTAGEPQRAHAPLASQEYVEESTPDAIMLLGTSAVTLARRKHGAVTSGWQLALAAICASAPDEKA